MVEEVGAGGFGSVWRGVAPDGTHVALKFLKPDLGGDVALRFEREARILSELQHRNIVRFFRFESGSEPWLATEFVHGESLSDWIGPHRSIAECMDVCTQIANALQAAHREGVIHRDLKPANIMVSRRPDGWHVTVLDFGLGKLLDGRRGDITATGQVIGTPGFMSPEQLRGETNIGPATDLYCLGAVMFAVFEHAPVFGGESPLEIGMKHLTERPPPMRSPAPAAVKDLVNRLLAKHPSARPAGVGAVLSVLRPRSAVVTMARRGPPTWVWGLGIFLLLAVAGGVIFLRDPPERIAPPGQRDPSAFVNVDSVETGVAAGRDVASGSGAGAGVDAGAAAGVTPSAGCGLQIDPPRPDGIVHLPPEHSRDEPLPLLVVLHEGGQTAQGVIDETGLLPLASRERFIVAAPKVESHRVLDVAEFVTTVKEAHCVDTDRVYALGHGRGSQAIDELGPLRVFAAVVASGHRLNDTEVDAVGARSPWLVPYLLLTAENDHKEPLEGLPPAISLDRHEERLRSDHQCTGEAVTTRVEGGVCRTWTCAVELRSCVIEGNRHWPGYQPSEPAKVLGAPSRFEHQEQVWQFLSQHRRKEPTATGCENPPGGGFHRIGDDVAYLPRNPAHTEPMPLVVGLHDKHQRPRGMLDELDLYSLAEEHGFVLYAPRGPMTRVGGGLPPSDDERSMWRPRTAYSNDFGRQQARFDHAVNTARTIFCIDPAAVYVVGHIGSGYFAESLRTNDAIAAVATFSFRRDRRQPVSHGLVPTRPYLFISPIDSKDEPPEGGAVRISIDDQIGQLATEHACARKEVSLKRSRSTCWTWQGCRAPLVTCKIEGPLGWPGFYENPKPVDFDHQGVLWSFLESHHAP